MNCSRKRWDAQKVDESFWQHLTKLLSSTTLIQEAVNKTCDLLKEDSESILYEIEVRKKELAVQQKYRRRLRDHLMQADQVLDSIWSDIQQLDQHIKTIHADLEAKQLELSRLLPSEEEKSSWLSLGERSVMSMSSTHSTDASDVCTTRSLVSTPSISSIMDKMNANQKLRLIRSLVTGVEVQGEQITQAFLVNTPKLSNPLKMDESQSNGEKSIDN